MTCCIRAGTTWIRALAIVVLAGASSVAAAGPRCINLEVYYRASDAPSAEAVRQVAEYVAERDGVRLRQFDLDGGEAEAAQQRLDRLLKYYRQTGVELPLVYGCRQIIHGLAGTTPIEGRLKSLLRMDVYTRAGCPKCAQARAYLKTYTQLYPGLEVRIFDIVSDARARDALQALTRRYKVAAVSVPVFHFCDKLMVGFDASGLMRRRLEKELNLWTTECPVRLNGGLIPRTRPLAPFEGGLGTLHIARTACACHVATVIGLIANAQTDSGEDAATPGQSDLPPPLPLPPESPAGEFGDDDMLPLPGDEETLPLPGDDLPLPEGESGGPTVADSQVVEVPVLGRLNLDAMGLPLFTIAIGLIDGFNPCAMWVLLFLLSILVNLKQRWKILAVAGTFVCISGLAYFAFMAAWLNVFLFVGLLRWVQVLLGTIAIVVGSIHVKDYFAFKKGVSLSIPEAAKPGIYARVRRIVTAENLVGAIVGASILAVLVNIVELLCTAGLPALYTQILAMQNLPTWNNYLYLGLYNLAYMADDALMVTLVVVTLGRHKLQETQGRWLKLLSGSVILVLGVIMLVRPEWLV
ncbi:MAG: glutaredoxin domain-containing protein [Maioricimonas sp. JB045]